jgi:ketosteroid isomerase-like protein
MIINLKVLAMNDIDNFSSRRQNRRGFVVASGLGGAVTMLSATAAQAQGSNGNSGTGATEVVAEFLRNTAPDKIESAANRLIAEDATYISLSFDNPDLKKILPWTGTSKGRQAFISTFTGVAKYWTIEDFQIFDIFGAGENVAVFGSFTYRSITRGKSFRSPFSIHAKVKNGLIAYFQFMEDTFASSRSFSSGGTWTIKTDPKGPEYQV